MRSDIAELWAADLDTNPPQVSCALETEKGHCCLGRLVRLAITAGVPLKIEHIKRVNDDVTFFDGHDGVLPDAVRDWAGMNSRSGRLDHTSLMSMNDFGMTFPQIATQIRQNWKKL